ncbi:MAG: cytochrome C [Comamonas sp.]
MNNKIDNDDNEDSPPRSRWIGVLIVVLALVIGLGMFNIGRLISRPKPEVTAAQAAVEANPALLVGRDLVTKGSDCMRCHTMELDVVGPAFLSIAKRYGDRPDGVEYLAGKIRSGSVGEWGRIVMPRHPQVTQEQAVEMATWMMALKPKLAAPAEQAAKP